MGIRNKLPAKVVEAGTITMLKRQLTTFMDRKGSEGMCQMQVNGACSDTQLGRYIQDGAKGLFLCSITQRNGEIPYLNNKTINK